ncbi:MAG: YafY family transcriptional regulator [Lachnospiraceae bacterium]
MEQSRLFKIVYHLLEKGKSTAPELAEKFEVSIRTIYRDLDTISAAGIPIYATQGKGGGIFIMQDFMLNKSLLSEQEKEQILMALQGISATEHNQTDELLMKLSGLFQSKVTNWIEVDFSEWYKNTPNYDVFNLIKNAIFNQYTITFSYFAREGNYSNRTVEPIKLIFKNKDWYLYGFCLLRNDFRFFKLTRIKDLEISSDTFIREVKSSHEIETVIKNKNFIHAKLKFSPKVAFRVYDEFTDNVSKDNQGNLYVNIDLPDNETLFSYILSFGDNVEILEPDYLRHSMKEKLALMLEKYIT